MVAAWEVVGDQDGGGRDWNTLRRQWPLARGGGEDWPAAGMVQHLPHGHDGVAPSAYQVDMEHGIREPETIALSNRGDKAALFGKNLGSSPTNPAH